jgi:hypothetical protein
MMTTSANKDLNYNISPSILTEQAADPSVKDEQQLALLYIYHAQNIEQHSV